jgi:hypothetical protein
METKVNIFVSYSHQNEDWVSADGKYRLIPWLNTQLEEQANIWTDHALKRLFGEEYTKLITQKVMEADFALLLISQDFVSSKFIMDIELPLIKKQYQEGKIRILPLLLTDLTKKGKEKLSWIFDLQTYPSDSKPLIGFSNDDAQWAKIKVDILDGVEHKIEEILTLKNKTKLQEIKETITPESKPIDIQQIEEIPEITVVQEKPKVEIQQIKKESKETVIPIQKEDANSTEERAKKTINTKTRKNLFTALIVLTIGSIILYFVISSGNKNEGSIQNQKNIQPELVKKDTLATNSENKQLAENKQSTKDNTKRETIKPKVTDKTSKVQAESIAEELRYVPINKGEVGKYKLMKYRFMNLTIGEQNVKSGNFENAIFIYKQLLNTFPDDESIYYKLAECYGKTGNLKMKSDAILKAQNILTKKTEDSVKTTIH